MIARKTVRIKAAVRFRGELSDAFDKFKAEELYMLRGGYNYSY